MTSTAPEQIVSAQRAYLYLAAVGTTAPVDVATAMSASFTNVGLFTPDSLSFSTEPEFEVVNSHQSDFEVRRLQTSDSASVAVDLQQWNAANFKAVYGGGEVVETSVGSGVFKFTPPKLGARTEKMAVVEVIDGTKIYRWVFPRTMQVEGVEKQLQKGQASVLPWRGAVLGGDDTDPWYVLTNDPAFDPTPA